MKDIVLITMQGQLRDRTVSLKRGCESVLWLGTEEPQGADAARACARAIKDGVLLESCNGVSFVLPGTKGSHSSLLVGYDSAVMLALVGEGVHDRMALYVRTVPQERPARMVLACEEGQAVELGRGESCEIRYDSVYVSKHHAKLLFSEGSFYVQDMRSGNGTFVNGEQLCPYQRRRLVAADIVRVGDLRLTVARSCVLLWPPAEVSLLPQLRTMIRSDADLPSIACDDIKRGNVDPFYPAPWLCESIQTPSLVVDPPPQAVCEDSRPPLLQLGPSFLMGLSAVYYGGNAVAGLMRGDAIVTLMPSICMALAMVGTTIIWPVVSSVYERRRSQKLERVRESRYVAYLDGVEDSLDDLAVRQTKALNLRLVSIETILMRARERSALLMSHTRDADDFLCVRAGTSTLPLKVDVNWPEQHFSLEDDLLWDRVAALRQSMPTLRDVPVGLDLYSHSCTGIVGDDEHVWEFARGLLVQICALYSYTEVRIALVANACTKAEWEPFAYVPHLLGSANEQRGVATTAMGVSRLVRQIVQVQGQGEAHLVMLCAGADLYREAHSLWASREDETHTSVSLVFLARRLNDLPRECDSIVEIARPLQEQAGQRGGARMFLRSDVAGTTRMFNPDVSVTKEEAWEFARGMARIRIDGSAANKRACDTAGFLELYRVGRTEQLNLAHRWATSDAAQSLRVPVGLDARGDCVCLDLHEKADGPHCLVAGTTGSGKSEFIISLVLSLCTCFAPDEVSFLLIDYKGGGLAGAFDNAKRRLPHLAGTITNLDGRLIGRALVSLKSELRRRQRILNDARSLTGEATMDIHRYLALYHQGMVLTPLPHLFVIADEFAELKQQEPAFMDELMSAARIGRSLGIHLILATQKPAGVINDQIWANARLKVALKVADAADSREIIHRDDAATLRRPGDFYALVGYDEDFRRGQAAYAGGPYVARERYERRRDVTVSLLDEEGQTIASLAPARTSAKSETSELNALLSLIERTARAQELCARPLWLKPLPRVVTLDDLAARYDTHLLPVTTCVVGELDDPASQSRHCLTLDVREAGNILLYGVSGSDVQGLLRAMLLSMLGRCGDDDLWVYVIDANASCLGCLKELPCVGGAAKGEDEQGVAQLLRVVEEEFARRRVLNEECAAARPPLVVAIADLCALVEELPHYEERITALARDGVRMGIYVLATAGGANSVRARLRSCFATVVPTMLSDAMDYAVLLGERCEVAPAPYERRGLARWQSSILEFQGAAFAKTSEGEAIAAFVRAHVDGQSSVPQVRTLPARVLWRHMNTLRTRSLPVGYSKRLVEPAWIDCAQGEAVLVVGNDRRSLSRYARGIVDVWARSGERTYCVVDLWSHMVHRQGERILNEAQGVDAFFAQGQAAEGVKFVLVLDAARIVQGLSSDGHQEFQRLVTSPCPGADPCLILVSEQWRLSGIYDEWYRAVVARGRGVWVADGFDEQGIFRVPRSAIERVEPSGRMEGFLIDAGKTEPVALLEGGEAT